MALFDYNRMIDWWILNKSTIVYVIIFWVKLLCKNMSLSGTFGVLPDYAGHCFCMDMSSIDINCCDVGI